MDSPTETRLEISDDTREWVRPRCLFPVTPESERIHVALSFGNRSSDVSPNHESESSYSELDSKLRPLLIT
ncbi:hypothetical protein Bca52824_095360 [Brassica carinata]|uniref:Uncharacterized protein n=1 Tax=Brassica carinata TaxID=52824 RepID=A0A8X7P207_BRACI|nr:hypothetical protein Bca52824_095360 [Brassica carinata]